MHRWRRFRTRRLIFWNVRHREYDAAMNRIDLEDAHIEVHRLVRDVRRIRHRARRRQLADRNEALDVVADIDDHALVHQANDFAAKLGADRIRLTNAEPRIFLGLLETE